MTREKRDALLLRARALRDEAKQMETRVANVRARVAETRKRAKALLAVSTRRNGVD
jgi:hypothetical protein